MTQPSRSYVVIDDGRITNTASVGDTTVELFDLDAIVEETCDDDSDRIATAISALDDYHDAALIDVLAATRTTLIHNAINHQVGALTVDSAGVRPVDMTDMIDGTADRYLLHMQSHDGKTTRLGLYESFADMADAGVNVGRVIDLDTGLDVQQP